VRSKKLMPQPWRDREPIGTGKSMVRSRYRAMANEDSEEFKDDVLTVIAEVCDSAKLS
jgi:hypothetical protein